ncbi:hypothetical protein [Arenimonas sp.]|uniref:hypothetical protein n=1 Tax=Arenimonas sp. TaxID=1872635 RepID=UPI002E34D92C|nr:hypothetical protein [Arenimonas sp.]HEX4854250.1 hypothetical protein [Arenimonas sp.]
MLVSDMVTDLNAALEQFPSASNWRVGIACYAEDHSGDINMMVISSFDADGYDDFTLVPEGMGLPIGIQENPITAGSLLAALESNPKWTAFAAYAMAESIRLPDGRVVTKNLPLWGTGVHDAAKLVYFYYGTSSPEA